MAGSRGSGIGVKTPLLNPWFITGAGLFLGHYILQNAGTKLPLIDAYLDDLLCMPVVLSIALGVMRFFKGTRVLTLSQILFTLIYCSLLFEVFLPLYSPKYTGDFIDVILYAAGACFFIRVMNK